MEIKGDKSRMFILQMAELLAFLSLKSEATISL